LAICTGVYGGLHNTARNDDFPTTIERLLWRISCWIITCSGGLANLFFALLALFGRKPLRNSLDADARDDADDMDDAEEGDDIAPTLLTKTWRRRSHGLTYEPVEFFIQVFYLFLILGASCYVAARCFITLEAFASLRYLPTDAYQTPTWTNVLLHW